MSLYIKKIVGQWAGADGRLAEITFTGEGQLGPDSWLEVDKLIKPIKKLSKILVLSDWSRVNLWVKNIPELLPDKTGVLVIFDNKKENGNEIFLSFTTPNNAAVFNANGSLRFQLENPFGSTGSFRSILKRHGHGAFIELGIRACPRDLDVCESVYVVDGSTPNIAGQLPRWVRD